jgi:hypothetical protein
VNEFKRTVIATLERLRGLSPTAVEDGIGRRHARGWRRILASMMPTSTLTAVLVWLRASERISVIVFFGHLLLVPIRLDILGRRCICTIHGAIIIHGRAEYDRRKVRLPAIALRTGNELNDLCTHAKASHNAMTTRPVSASDTRCAVMSTSSSFCAHCSKPCGEQPDCSTGTRNGVFNMRQIAGAAIFGREPIPWLQGPRAAVARPRRVPARSRTG